MRLPVVLLALLLLTINYPDNVKASTDDSLHKEAQIQTATETELQTRTQIPTVLQSSSRTARQPSRQVPASIFPEFLRGTLTPPAPFPIVIHGVAGPLEQIRPGIRSFREFLVTTTGPLVVNGILIDPRTPGIQFKTILAHDRIVSAGETLSSMAIRTGAVAGINGDYFAIHQTNEPLGIVVNDGNLLKTPGRRVAFSVDTDAQVRISPFHLSGTVQWGSTSVSLTGINSWPPDGGASLILPNYGSPRLASLNHFLPLASLSFNNEGTTYRVLDDTTSPVANHLGLGLGPAILDTLSQPEIGSTILIHQVVIPGIEHLQAAIGGGPQLIADHGRTRDEDDPLDDENGRRFPLSGLGRFDDGEILMLTVDGRSPTRSVGLTRLEFGALFEALGASDAMCLDSGGSTTLVARRANQGVMLLNAPSGGSERHLGDAFLVYATMPNPLMLPIDDGSIRPRSTIGPLPQTSPNATSTVSSAGDPAE